MRYDKTVYGEMPVRQNVSELSVLMAKCPHGEKCLRWSVRRAKFPYCKMSHGEISHGKKTKGEKSEMPFHLSETSPNYFPQTWDYPIECLWSSKDATAQLSPLRSVTLHMYLIASRCYSAHDSRNLKHGSQRSAFPPRSVFWSIWLDSFFFQKNCEI